ncbi:MAG: futalosine hydrolase [Fibrobacter sp.]|jgi:futalosine hydrolase|nr:futalosine hydrolase [Fibrobacter sp.]
MKKTLLAIPSMLEASSFSAGTELSVLGVGLVNFSAGLAKALHSGEYERVIQLGIGGAYSSSGLKLGELVFVEEDQAGDLGYQETDGSFHRFKAEMVGKSVYRASSEPLACFSSLPKVRAISVNCCTGTQNLAAERENLYGAQIETMEGVSCFALAEAFGCKAYQIRAVSNFVTARDPSRWEISKALQSLQQWVNTWKNKLGFV